MGISLAGGHMVHWYVAGGGMGCMQMHYVLYGIVLHEPLSREEEI